MNPSEQNIRSPAALSDAFFERFQAISCPLTQKLLEPFLSRSSTPVIIKGAPNPQQVASLMQGLGTSLVARLPNVIVYGNLAKGFYSPKSPMPLTLGYVLKGHAILERENKQMVVRDQSYYLVNASDFSTLTEEQSEVFRVSFQPGFLENTWAGLVRSDKQLLEDSQDSFSEPIEFFEKLYLADANLSPFLLSLRKWLDQNPNPDPLCLDEIFHELGDRLLWVHRDLGREISRVPSVKASNRVEIYRRLSFAQDFIEAHLTKPIDLESIARAASFSAHYFLRLFKRVFQKTPYQYVLQRRLELFRNRLLIGDDNITELCYDVGFSDLSNLSHYFRKQFGVSPRRYQSFHKK